MTSQLIPALSGRGEAQLVEGHGSDAFKSLRVSCTSTDIGRELVMCLASMVRREVLRLLALAPAVAVLGDEGTDAANLTQLVTFNRCLVMGPALADFGSPRTFFTRVVSLPRGDAQTVFAAYSDGFRRDGLDWSQKGAVSVADGASVFAGKLTGVHRRLKGPAPATKHSAAWEGSPTMIDQHCPAHVLPLSGEKRTKVVPHAHSTALPSIEALGRRFRGSPRAEHVFNEVQKIEEISIYHIIVNCWARWLTHDDCARPVLGRFPQLLTALRKLATGEILEDVGDSELPAGVPLGEPSVTATGLLNIMSCSEFLWFLCVLCDYLPLIARISREFQKEGADFSAVDEQTGIVAAKLRAMIAAPGVHVAQFPELVKACTDAGHFKVAKPRSPARARRRQRRRRRAAPA